MDRRRFVAAAVAVGLAGPAALGAPRASVRVGYLDLLAPADGEMLYREFVEGLQSGGYAEGRNLRLLRKSAGGRMETLRTLAAELGAAKVDVILATSAEAARSARVAAPGIPTVFVISSDPVLEGLVASLSRPRGALTGVVAQGEDLAPKRLEILKEAFPAIRKVAVVGSNLAISRARTEDAARRLQLEMLPMSVHGPDDLRAAAAAISRGAADAVMAAEDVDAVTNLRMFVSLLTATGRPAMFNADVFVDEGGLMAYGVSLRQLYRRAASMAILLLEGAQPGDVPVEQPTRYELVVNLRTAEANRIALPRALLLRADRVIR